MSHSQSFFQSSTRKQKKPRTFVRDLLVGVLVVLVLWLMVVSFAMIRLLSLSSDASTSLKQAKQEVVSLQFQQANTSLASAQKSFAGAKKMFPILQTAQWLPLFGTSIQSSQELVSGGMEAVSALGPVLDVGTDVLQLSGLDESYFEQVKQGTSPHISFSDLPSETKAIMLQRLQNAADKFVLLSKRLELIETDLDRISNSTLLGPFNGLLQPLRESLSQTRSTLNQVSRFAYLFPVFAGASEPQSFLVLFLNNTELRPGGGFIGTYGVLNVSHGSILSFKTADVYSLDHLVEKKITTPAPFPLQTYNATPVWFMRDANWSPDFSVSAKGVMRQFQDETNLLSPEEKKSVPYAQKIDGVIGLTPDLAKEILKITGPITVAGQTFTAENIADVLEYQVEQGFAKQGIPEAQRKEIVSALTDQVIANLMKHPLSDWGRVIDVMETLFTQKQLMVYHTDPSVESVIQSVGWGGVVLPKTSDTQMVVDANLASLKSDPVVSRAYKYEVFKNTSGDWIGRTTVRYTHTGTFDWKTTRYRTYTRLYVPKGSTLIRLSGSMGQDVSEELGMTVFGTFVTIDPQTSQEVVFEYQLPESVKSAIEKKAYRLTFIKQPGSQNIPLTLHLDFDKNVVRANPAEEKNAWGDTIYQWIGSLDQDRVFEVNL